MARNQGFNVLTGFLGTGMLFVGGVQGWKNAEQVERIRERDSNIAEVVIHLAGDQKHIVEEIWGSHDGAPTPVEGALFLTDLELAIGIGGAVMAASSVKALRK